MTTERASDNVEWGVTARREHRWPAVLALIVAVILYVTLPSTFTFGGLSKWILPLLEGALLIPLTITAPHRHPEESTAARVASLVLIVLINAANVLSLVLLINSLLFRHISNGRLLMYSSVEIWLTNVIVFGLWYWELDRGGPAARLQPQHHEPDFLFPQMTAPAAAPPHWVPRFMDYLYVSFTNATAFSPTDTMPLTAWAKLLMMIQAMTSLLTVALVAARAVNILR